MIDAPAMLISCAQAGLGVRVIGRLIATVRGRRIVEAPVVAEVDDRVSVLVPVLDEEARLGPCLEGLVAQGPEVAEIVVVDGGSVDATLALVQAYARLDERVRLVDARPLPMAVNGKAYGLRVGMSHLSPDTRWVLTVDADVRPKPALVRSMLAHARRERVRALSVATTQRLSGPAEGLLHPAMLATLVYRYGIPGHATARSDRVQANGQCFLVERAVLCRAGGFASGLDSVCEDVTVARAIAQHGERVGFYEADGLVSVAMYAGWRDAWENWTRSLPMRDRFSGLFTGVGLVEIVLVQALPLYLAPWFGHRFGWRHPATVINVGLLVARFGTLAGMARAYERRPWTYWLSPLADLPVALRLCQMARRRTHRWRGRIMTRGASM